MKVRGLYTSITQAAEHDISINLNDYLLDINPIDYDFCIEINKEYNVVGSFLRSENIWLYIIDDNDIRVLPAKLFDWIDFKTDSYQFYIDANQNNSLGVIVKSLALIDCWYEKYLNDENIITEIINSDFINNLNRG